MADIIYADNFPATNILEQSFLDADAAGGQAVVALDNASNFTANDFVFVGLFGQENGQILQIQSITGNNVTFTTNLAVTHYRNETVYKLRGDKINFYRAPDVNGSVPNDGTMTLQATVPIFADQLMTPFTDSTGGAAYWYKSTILNSFTSAETPIGDASAVRGGNFGHYASAQDVRIEAGLENNRWIKDSFIFSKLLAAESEVNGALIIGNYPLPLKSVPDMVFQATVLLAAGYVLSKDYGPEHTGTNKDATSKIAQARVILDKIESSMAQLVDNVTKQSLDKGLVVRGYPDDSAASNTPSEDSVFKITDIY